MDVLSRLLHHWPVIVVVIVILAAVFIRNRMNGDYDG